MLLSFLLQDFPKVIYFHKNHYTCENKYFSTLFGRVLLEIFSIDKKILLMAFLSFANFYMYAQTCKKSKNFREWVFWGIWSFVKKIKNLNDELSQQTRIIYYKISTKVRISTQ